MEKSFVCRYWETKTINKNSRGSEISYLYHFLGISGKSQFLFALVYTTRYLDLLTNYVSLYNSFMKVLSIALQFKHVIVNSIDVID